MAYSGELIKRLLVEIDGNPAKLQAALKKAGVDAKVFAIEANRAGKIAGASADAVASKQGNAARAIASATETIARQGKVSGEAAKQLIAQGANAALFFGPQGAIVGAIGIATLAMVGMFTRVKREAAEAASETRKEFAKIAQLDMMGAARRLFQLNQGDQMLREDLASRDPAARDAARQRLRDDFGSVGVLGLQEERKRLQAEMDEIRAGGGRRPGEATGALNSRYVQMREDLEAIIKLLPEVTKQAAFAERRFFQTANEAGGVAKDAFALDAEARATKAGEKSAEAIAEAAKDAREKLDAESKALGAKVAQIGFKFMATSVEQATAEVDAALKEARRLMVEGKDVDLQVERIDELELLRGKIVEVAGATAEAEALLQRLGEASRLGVEPSVDDFVDLNAVIDKLRDKMRTLVVDSEPYRKLLAEINKLEKERADRIKNIADANVIGDGGDSSKPDARTAADYAREIQQAADGALQLAQNLGGADKNAIGLLRTVGQIAAASVGLADAISAKSAGGIIGSSLTLLGALTTVFGESPAKAQRDEELARNTEAIRELTKQAGQLGLGISGSAAGTAASGLSGFLANMHPTFFPGDAREAARAFGLDVSELEELAKAHGVALNADIESFFQLQEAIGLTITKLGEFGDDLTSQRRQAEAEIDIYGVTDPLEQLKIRQAAFAGRSGTFDSITAGLDLSTAEGREQARRNAQAWFEVMKAQGGALTDEQLAGLNGDEFLAGIETLIEGLKAIDAAAGIGAAGSSSGTIVGLRSLTEATGSRLEDRFRSLDVKASAAQETRVAMLGALMQIANAVLPVPAIPSGFALARAQQSGAAGAGGAPTFIIESIVIQMPVTLGATDPGQMLSAVQDGMEAAINEAVYRATVREQRIRGDLRMNR